MEIQKRRPLIILTGVCALGLALSGCGSKGIYTPYTEGSTLAQGKPEEAVFSVSYDAPNELFHQPRYDITLAVKDTDKTITLGFIMDGDFQSPANDTVQLTARCKDGMTVKTNDPLLQGLIDHITVSLKKTDLKSAKTYGLELILFDDENRVVGRFNDNLIEKTATGKTNATGAAEEDPTSPAAIYEWIAARAKITASN